MENSNKTFNKLLEKTIKHLESKKYLYKPVIYLKDNNGNLKLDANDNKIKKKITPTSHKNVVLSIAFNMALNNYSSIRDEKDIKPLKNTEISDMLVRFFSKKFYDKTGDAHTIINENENIEFKAVEEFKNIEYKIYGAIKRLRYYHSHYVHEPSILSFTDLFDNKTLLSDVYLEEANNWFENMFDNAKIHITNSLQSRQDKLNEEINKNQLDKNSKKEVTAKIAEIEETLETFRKFIVFRYKNEEGVLGDITLNGQLFMASMFLFKREMKIILDKWRHFRLDKDIKGYGNSIHSFFTYYSMSESYSINNYSDDLLKFRNITSKLTTIPASNHQSLAFIYEKIRELNKVPYDKIDKIDTAKESQEIMFLEVLQKYPETIPNEIAKLNKKIRRERKHYKKIKLEKKVRELEIYEIKPGNIPKKIQELNDAITQKKAVKNQVIPIRNRHIFTDTLLQYMLDNDLFGDNIKIAIAKNMTDRLDYYKKYEDIDENESLTALKNRKKLTNGLASEDIRVLNEHYKELKRNFQFKNPEELLKLAKEQEVADNNNEEDNIYTLLNAPKGYKFVVNKKNALIRYTHVFADKREIDVNITISPQLLLKVVFVHLINGQNIFKTKVKQFIRSRIEKFNVKGMDVTTLVSSFSKGDIPLSKVLPRSILQTANALGKDAWSVEKRIQESVENRIKNFENFKRENLAVPKPWQYMSKKKIDVILEYIHFKLLYDVYANDGKYYKKTDQQEDTDAKMRHLFFNVDSYDIARQYFRFFGRYKKGTIAEAKGYGHKDFVMPKQISALTNEENYAEIFDYINADINIATNLEELFELVINRYIGDLEKFQNKIAKFDQETLINILKINRDSKVDNVNSLINTHYLKTFALSDAIVSVKEVCINEWESFKKEKEKNLGDKEYRFTEFSFIRNYLQSLDKNQYRLYF